ncbi:MAG TPA: lipocalin-like domain-containing protein [Smithella sp.]|nr:lipocalin-like domain-containing protein [Smithella sp.]MDM7987043.1 lipocalin-like domain-containing protein [Smithella sp.]HNY50119.1 lipocalin-like domain-containing protein [Smithella sp.]HOG89564.1 lipocalin-like domain-containing protein [Smithella sp.]HOU49900.1 lipocalin-like domain-containing protein [Smithella sp.]
MMNDERFLGTWTLKSVVRKSPDGTISKPFADNPLGYISYMPGGFMHAILMKSGRTLTGVAPEELSDAARSKKLLLSWKYIMAGIRYVKAMTSFMSYCGTYEIRGNIVVHHVKAAMVPDWIGTDLTREFVFSGNTLTLSARDAAGNVMDLLWERVS